MDTEERPGDRAWTSTPREPVEDVGFAVELRRDGRHAGVRDEHLRWSRWRCPTPLPDAGRCGSSSSASGLSPGRLHLGRIGPLGRARVHATGGGRLPSRCARPSRTRAWCARPTVWRLEARRRSPCAGACLVSRAGGTGEAAEPRRLAGHRAVPELPARSWSGWCASLASTGDSPGTPPFEVRWLDNSPDECAARGAGGAGRRGRTTGFSGGNLGFGVAHNRMMARAFADARSAPLRVRQPGCGAAPATASRELVAEAERAPRARGWWRRGCSRTSTPSPMTRGRMRRRGARAACCSSPGSCTRPGRLRRALLHVLRGRGPVLAGPGGGLLHRTWPPRRSCTTTR